MNIAIPSSSHECRLVTYISRCKYYGAYWCHIDKYVVCCHIRISCTCELFSSIVQPDKIITYKELALMNVVEGLFHFYHVDGIFIGMYWHIARRCLTKVSIGRVYIKLASSYFIYIMEEYIKYLIFLQNKYSTIWIWFNISARLGWILQRKKSWFSEQIRADTVTV